MYTDLKELLNSLDIVGRPAYNILLAVSEAFTNALIHGNKYRSSKSIGVSITVNNDVIIADISDEGSGEPDTVAGKLSVDPWSEGGRGIALMKMIADTIDIEKCSETGGIRIRMVFEKESLGKSIKPLKDSHSGG
jgi:serine/threonine-protein kinase RsbW